MDKRESEDYLFNLPIPAIVMNDGQVIRNLNFKGIKETTRKIKKTRNTIVSRESTNLPDMATTLTEEERQRRGERKRRGEVARVNDSTLSSELKLGENSWFESSSAEAISPNKRHSAMERADLSPYSSDAWEEDTDSDGHHSDSSDDDDPKSQVDRLIEKGTLIYLNGENSALSSEGESDDEDDFYNDSESDITDVSPLASANPSPLGLSPVLSRRKVPTSPLALHDNRELIFNKCSPPEKYSDCDSDDNSEDECAVTHTASSREDATNMDLLLRAVIELENQNSTGGDAKNYRSKRRSYHQHHSKNTREIPQHNNDSSNGFLHPIRDNPHHHHLRKNMSFTNEEVRKIDRENKLLLKKIMAAHHRSRTNNICNPSPQVHHRPTNKPTNAAVNRRKNEDKIRRENLMLLKKIQEAKPSKEIEISERPRSSGRNDHTHLSTPVTTHRQIQPPSNSCGAFLRSITRSPHAGVPNSRKETAL